MDIFGHITVWVSNISFGANRHLSVRVLSYMIKLLLIVIYDNRYIVHPLRVVYWRIVLFSIVIVV